MAPRLKKQAQCQVCATNPLKYTCSKCYITYCSVPCYKEHQPTDPLSNYPTEGSSKAKPNTATILEPERNPPLRSLTSLKWPYVPEESAFPDPLKRDDPKDLQLRQYEAIATSPKIREILSKHENFSVLLTTIDKLRGNAREEALQKALGVTPPDIDDWRKPKEFSEDMLALRELAEAVETAIRGGNDTALGLNWEEES
ncbi:hypothetical protein AN958_03523 [Leucoagaricus sp. SymC.cos]|nr:hypothetical protein AN958_03523 [Leucoagaricus sp. SymC.cos]